MKKNSSNSPPAKAVPQRTCLVCRQVMGKKELVRLVRTPPGGVEIDKSGKKEGRGAYLCRNTACWDKLAKGRQLENALKSGISKKELELLVINGKEFLKELTLG